MTVPAADLLAAWDRGNLDTAGRPLTLLAAMGRPVEEHLSIGRRDAALLELRATLFGTPVRGAMDCPACGELLELAFELDDVKVTPASPDRSGTDLTVADGRFEVSFRLPDTADLALVSMAGSTATTLMDRCVRSATRDGVEITVAELPVEVVALVENRMEAADPQADVRLDLVCPVCTAGAEVAFDIASFLWREVDAWARGLLAEVHQLAGAYGWTEADILALGPARRRFYLEMTA
ncbi:hypothetical protein [Actinomycetospora cinnamomea]|uniref:Phage baseplate protein n=1 Tax=Actinomycetospora cinnamomea TaxID=663609 RepID=A0A2U1F7P8_9PSEU|nr:hypothetical protein [Actinomycetospora cinnamomea]PVZ08192.1 hypothetical protein C8D89_10975 [Actinomycetospora cinnamomea]